MGYNWKLISLKNIYVYTDLYFFCLLRLIELGKKNLHTSVVDLAIETGYNQLINCKRKVDFSNTGKMNTGKGSRGMHVSHHELTKAENLQSHANWRMGIIKLRFCPEYLVRDSHRLRKICNIFFFAGLRDSDSSHAASSKNLQEKIFSDMNKGGSYRDSKYYGVIIRT